MYDENIKEVKDTIETFKYKTLSNIENTIKELEFMEYSFSAGYSQGNIYISSQLMKLGSEFGIIDVLYNSLAAEFAHALVRYYRGESKPEGNVSISIHELYDIAATFAVKRPYNMNLLKENAKVGKTWIKHGIEGIEKLRGKTDDAILADAIKYIRLFGEPGHQIAAYMWCKLLEKCEGNADVLLKAMGKALIEKRIDFGDWKKFFVSDSV